MSDPPSIQAQLQSAKQQQVQSKTFPEKFSLDEVNGPVSLPQVINPLNQSLIPRNCQGPQLLLLKHTKLGFGQTEQMKVSIRKQN